MRYTPFVPNRYKLSSGCGESKEGYPLVAFDRALRSAGIADTNLSRVSSILPPGAVCSSAGEGIEAGQPLHVAYGAEQVFNDDTDLWLVITAGVAVAVPLKRTQPGVIVECHAQSGNRVQAALTGQLRLPDDNAFALREIVRSQLTDMATLCMGDRGHARSDYTLYYEVAVGLVAPKTAGAVIAACALWYEE